MYVAKDMKVKKSTLKECHAMLNDETKLNHICQQSHPLSMNIPEQVN